LTVERLQKILSRAGVASRRASERIMLEGRVTVNGVTIRELGAKADPDRDDVRVDGQRIRLTQARRYILLNKPPGYVSTRSDPQGRPTVVDLVGAGEYVYPVGRLDFDSEGLLILTNDGDLAARLTHPRYGVPRVYQARVLGVPDEHDLHRLARGLLVEGRRTAPAAVSVLSRPAPTGRQPRRATDANRSRERPPARSASALLEISLREGRNRQVRKMCEAIGHPVDRLKRVSIGPIRDDRLKPGQWRELTAAEVGRLRAAGAQDTGRVIRAGRPPSGRRREP
jgi:pseudouridine synthase